MTPSHLFEPEYRAGVRRLIRLWRATIFKDGKVHRKSSLCETHAEALAWACSELRRLADDVKVGGSE